ncbi:hypothetical protein K2173_000947 [Erythroxylum novogranatense]|uniref:aldehyde dehydrogenase (NAD(+)) n=1 Tax=Erythroxylum novogranatense TaxID=1862640 RepID=A0AAV8TQK4_9ROSI|nr:hypothetical protein K2173_000947 [Erythroxylum novogranatense]
MPSLLLRLPLFQFQEVSFGCSSDGAARRILGFHYRQNIKQKQSSVLSFPHSTSIYPSYSISRSSSSCCSATLSVVADEVKRTFGTSEASSLVEELRQSFRSGRTKSYEWRISQLKSILRMVEEKEKDIYEALYKDLAKPEIDAFLSEIAMTKSSCKLAIEQLSTWMKPEEVKASFATYPSSAKIVPEPLGVVLVISTWNFPFLLSIDPVIGAISAGNAVVLKPSEIAPATSSLLLNLIEQYLDRSAVRVVEGAVPETTALLEQQWDKIFYTGSAMVGRIVMTAAAKHLTPVVLELGGKCPAIVDSNTNLEVTVRRIIAGKWQCNNAQACIGVDYLITTKDFAPKLIEALKARVEEFFGKDPMESKDMSRIVSLHHFNRLVRILDEDKVSKKIVHGGRRDQNRLKIAPTIVLDPPRDSSIMQEEIFGPLLPVVTVESINDSFAEINSRPKPLAAYLFTNDEKLKSDFIENVSSGGMLINDTVLHVSIDTLPFGGVGESGMGSYHGKYSFEAFSHKKSVLIRSFSGDATVRYPPYTPRKTKLLKALVNGNIFEIILALLWWSKD